MKKFFILILIVFSSGSAFCQIEDEISAYVDSTEILVKNGRKMIFKELSDNNIAKVKEVYDYLTDLTRTEPYSAFYYLEDLYINLLSDDWATVESLMLDYEKYRNKTVYPNSTELVKRLSEMASENGRQILAGAAQSGIDEQAKRIIEILVYLLESEKLDDEYNSRLNALKRDFGPSAYDSLIKGFLPNKYIRASWSFSFGSGMVFTTSDLSSNFSNNASFNASMDFNVQKVFASLYLHGTNLKLREPFMLFSDSDTLNFEKGEKFTYLDAGLKTGYLMIRGERFNLAPYLSISGSFLESTRYEDPEDNDLEYEIFNSFTYGLGLHTEFKLYEFKTSNLYYGGTTLGYLSIKLDGGYNKILKFKDPYATGDTPYFMVSLAYGFGDF